MSEIGTLVTEDTAEKVKKPKKVLIAQITLSRAKGAGLELKIKSKTLEEFIKTAYGGETATMQTAAWGIGEKFYKCRSNAEHPCITATRHSLTLDGTQQHGLLINGETINMAFLRVVGISNGKTFRYPGLYRESDIAAIAQSINEGIKNLFKEYNTPTGYEIEIMSEE